LESLAVLRVGVCLQSEGQDSYTVRTQYDQNVDHEEPGGLMKSYLRQSQQGRITTSQTQPTPFYTGPNEALKHYACAKVQQTDDFHRRSYSSLGIERLR